jgi:hypothetical protein
MQITARSLDEEEDEIIDEIVVQQPPLQTDFVASQSQPIEIAQRVTSISITPASQPRSIGTPRRLVRRLSMYEDHDHESFDPESEDLAPARSFTVSFIPSSLPIVEHHEE